MPYDVLWWMFKWYCDCKWMKCWLSYENVNWMRWVVIRCVRKCGSVIECNCDWDYIWDCDWNCDCECDWACDCDCEWGRMTQGMCVVWERESWAGRIATRVWEMARLSRTDSLVGGHLNINENLNEKENKCEEMWGWVIRIKLMWIVVDWAWL